MRSRSKTVAGLTAGLAMCGASAVALTGAGAASAAKTPPARAGGVAFVATTAAGGVSIVLSDDRRQIRTLLFAYEQSCSDGDTTYDFDRLAAIPISANRTFSYRYVKPPQASTQTPGATIGFTSSGSGTLNKAGTKIVGTMRSTVAFVNPAGGSYTCDTGTVQFKAVS